MAEAEADLSRLLTQLDETQRLAVCEDPSVSLLILAGAGSGKTLTMASRIAFTILRGVAPEHVLGLCFSRQAAETLRERVAAVLPVGLAPLVSRLKLKTFHAFGLECLRRFGRIDLSTEVYDARRQRELAGAVVEAHAEHYKSMDAVLALVDYVNKAKTKKNMRVGELDPSRQAAYLFRFYQSMLHDERGAVDFGDLEQMLLESLQPTRAKPLESDTNSNSNAIPVDENLNGSACSVPSDIALQLRAQYTHIVVDEFQDLNEVQLECLALLAGDECRVTCVGDPNQCIYSWRGATANSFERWRSRFPQTRVVKLGTNYRSSAEIVDAVNHVSQLSQHSFKGACGRRLTLVRCRHICEQPSLLVRVVEELLRARDTSLPYKDIAIVCRTRRTVREAVAALERENIPVRELRQSKPDSLVLVRAMLSYLRLCVHPHSNLDVECVLRDAPNHFAAAAATRFVFALQAECLERRRRLSAAELKHADSHAVYSYYTILRELVHNGFAHVHERLKTTKPQQKMLRTLIEVTTAAHDALGRPYCDIEEVVRSVAERAGFDFGKASDIKIRRRASIGLPNSNAHSNSRHAPGIGTGHSNNSNNNNNNNNNIINAKRQRSAAAEALMEDMLGDEDSAALHSADECGVSIAQLLLDACRAVEAQAAAERSAAEGKSENKISHETHAKGMARNDAYTMLQRVIDEFLALLPTDDFGPLCGTNSAVLKTENRNTINTTNTTNTNRGGGEMTVTVTTVHQAKGREWLAVVVPGCYEGEFPIDARSAEEKRVFYVAMSRAMRDLVFITADRGAVGRDNDGERETSLQITPYLQPLLQQIEIVNITDDKSPFCEEGKRMKHESCV